jgi:exodeoxyribonuclease VII small subunit
VTEPLAAEQSFEESLAELDRVVQDLEDGQVGLEESLARYGHGVGLLKRCYALLSQAEQRILTLTGEDGDGKPVLQPFAPAEAGEAPRTEARRMRRPSGPVNS